MACTGADRNSLCLDASGRNQRIWLEKSFAQNDRGPREPPMRVRPFCIAKLGGGSVRSDLFSPSSNLLLQVMVKPLLPIG